MGKSAGQALRLAAIRVRESALRRDSLSLLERFPSLQPADIESARRVSGERRYAAARYAFRESPLYRERFLAAGVGESDLEAQRGWDRLPILEKADLRENLGSLYAQSFRGRAVTVRTGGSTGQPLAFEIDWSLPAYSIAAARRGQRWWGLEPGAKWVRVWGTQRAISRHPVVVARTLAKEIVDRLCGTMFLSAFDVSDEGCRRAVQRIEAFRPEGVFGYGMAIYMIADFALRHSLTHKLGKVKAVVYTSEYLTPRHRERISEAFCCPVVSEYGSVETGVIAYDCPCGLQHIAQEFMDVEVLGEDGVVRPTGKGEAVVTHFFARKLPLIRYRLGDIIEIAETDAHCPNGFVGKSLLSLYGRNNDVIYSPSGRALHPELFDYILRSVGGVRRAQVREGALGELTVLVEALDPAFASGLASRIATALEEHLGAEFKIATSIVPSIPLSPAGKFRLVIGNPSNKPPAAAATLL